MTVAKLDDDLVPGEGMTVNSDVEQSVGDDLELKNIVSESIPSLEEQRTIVHDALKEPLVVGDTWYLLDIHWYKQWKRYADPISKTTDEHEHPGPIDNTPMFKIGCAKLKEHLLEGSDYKLISASGWDQLVQWYGLAPEQEAISRIVVEHGHYVKDTKVEVYLIELQLSTFRDLEKVEVCEFSKVNTIGEVVKKAKDLFGIDIEEESRVWNKFMTQTYELISKLENTLQDSGIGSGQWVLSHHMRFFLKTVNAL